MGPYWALLGRLGSLGSDGLYEILDGNPEPGALKMQLKNMIPGYPCGGCTWNPKVCKTLATPQKKAKARTSGVQVDFAFHSMRLL